MSKLLIGIIGAVGLSSVVIFGLVFSHVASSTYNPDQQLDFAMSLLDEGRWDLADRIARDIENAELLTPAREPTWNYVRGVAGTMAIVDILEQPHARMTLWGAADYLEKSREAGFPIGHRGKGAYYLGYCYFQTYDWPEAIEALEPVLKGWPQKRSEAFDMMVEACLRQYPPDRERGNELIKKWESIPGLTDEERYQIQLRKANVAFLDGNWEKCEQELEAIPDGAKQSAWASLARGRWKLENAGELAPNDPNRRALYNEALEIFRKLVLHPSTPAQARRQSAFLMGVILHKVGRFEESISTLSGVRQRNPQSAEAVASGLEEAEIKASMGQYDDAIETARHVINDLGDVRLFDERWMPLAELRKRLLALGREMQGREHFAQAIRLASYLPPVFPAADAVRLEAESYKVWAAQLEREMPLGPSNQRTDQRRMIDTKYTLAGDRFRTLAKIEMRSTAYPSILWEAIDAYRNSHQLDQANELLIEYLNSEERARRPRGLLALGQNYLNAGRWNDVLPPLERCLSEFPDHPSCYEVRLVIAQALTEKEELEKASEMLLKNLYDGNLQPDSKLWRDSLFALGNVIYRRGDQLLLEVELQDPDKWNEKLAKLKDCHEEMLSSIDRLAEAVQRFGDDTRALEARYAIGRAYRSASVFPQQMLESGQITIEAARRELTQKRRQLLTSSLEGFRSLRRALGDAQERSTLLEGGQSLLRNCYFGEADVLFDLGNYDDAILAYRNVGNRFMNEPEALEALVQIAECYRKLGQVTQAQRTLVQAEQLLSRIPPEQDARFSVVTRADRVGWQQLLAWLKST